MSVGSSALGAVQVLLLYKDTYTRDAVESALSQLPVVCELLSASSAAEALARIGQQVRMFC